jgi:hypothetical protein
MSTDSLLWLGHVVVVVVVSQRRIVVVDVVVIVIVIVVVVVFTVIQMFGPSMDESIGWGRCIVLRLCGSGRIIIFHVEGLIRLGFAYVIVKTSTSLKIDDSISMPFGVFGVFVGIRAMLVRLLK